MNILGLDEITLTANDLGEAGRYLADLGLHDAGSTGTELCFHAKDGTGVRVRRSGDPALPASGVPDPNLRQITWGVETPQDLERLAAELRKDRDVRWSGDGGGIHSVDDDGMAIAFRITRRVPIANEPVKVNVPGLPPQRKHNEVHDFNARVVPSTFSHVVLYTRDFQKAGRFYEQRLGFRVSDRFVGSGVFLRAPGSEDHHQLFLLQRAPHRGLHHMAFHVRDLNEVMLGGRAMVRKGWTSAWGPGRHIIGGNIFWYFDSPFGGHVEIDADMDVVNDAWTPREMVAGPDTTAIWTTSFKG